MNAVETTTEQLSAEQIRERLRSISEQLQHVGCEMRDTVGMRSLHSDNFIESLFKVGEALWELSEYSDGDVRWFARLLQIPELHAE